jgi:hypothetical protein
VTTAILLIPGFFGYGAFGPPGAPLLEYFAGVINVLGPSLPPEHAILVHEPPPTGSLDERVASLHEAIWMLQRGERLPHAAQAVLADRVHLVGHSTGGLDARLFANPKFHWSGGPRGAERTAAIGTIGRVVTLSAPLRGTPLVDHAVLARDTLLGVTQALTLLGTFRSSRFDSSALEYFRATVPWRRRTPRSGVAAKVVVEAARRAALSRGASDADAEPVARQVEQFVDRIENDRQLFGDLAVDRMERVNREIEGGDDLARIDSYVTVSPRPPILDIGLDLPARVIYRILYGMTAQAPLAGDPPTGAPIGPGPTITRLAADATSCDGVVPTRSQTLDGKGVAIVLADHLDVVGSFPGGSGINVLRSRSDFDTIRFRELWASVAQRLI